MKREAGDEEEEMSKEEGEGQEVGWDVVGVGGGSTYVWYVTATRTHGGAMVAFTLHCHW